MASRLSRSFNILWMLKKILFAEAGESLPQLALAIVGWRVVLRNNEAQCFSRSRSSNISSSDHIVQPGGGPISLISQVRCGSRGMCSRASVVPLDVLLLLYTETRHADYNSKTLGRDLPKKSQGVWGCCHRLTKLFFGTTQTLRLCTKLGATVISTQTARQRMSLMRRNAKPYGRYEI